MLSFRFADENDVDLLYKWANDKIARQNSYNADSIAYEDHVKWFKGRMNSNNHFFYIFSNDSQVEIGLVRIDIKQDTDDAVISIIVDASHRGLGYAATMITMASDHFMSNHHTNILAFIFSENMGSIKSFVGAGFKLIDEKPIDGRDSKIFLKSAND